VNWILTLPFCAVLVELVMRLPFIAVLHRLRVSSSRALHVVRAAKVSDHWKEKAMGAYARQTFAASAKIAALLAVVLGVAAVLVIGLDQISDGFQAFVLSWGGIGLSVIAATLYVMARKAIFRG
jgi:hypothetical protein